MTRRSGLYSGPNYLAPQGTFQSDKQLRYDGTWTKGAHNMRYGESMNRILGGGFAGSSELHCSRAFSSAQPAGELRRRTGAAPCAGDPINGYKARYFTLGNGKGFFTEKPGFGLKGGGMEDWREGAYIADTWKATSYLTLTAGVRWSADTGPCQPGFPRRCARASILRCSSRAARELLRCSTSSSRAGQEDTPALGQLRASGWIRVQPRGSTRRRSAAAWASSTRAMCSTTRRTRAAPL